MEKERDRLTDRQKEKDKKQVLYFVRTERKGFRVRESKKKIERWKEEWDN